MIATAATVRGRVEREAAGALALAPSDLAFLYVNGWSMDLCSLTALGFRRGEDRPAIVAKLARGDDRDRLRAEHDNLRRLAASPLPELAASVPRPISFVDSGGTAVLVESVVPGEGFDPAPEPRRVAAGIDLAVDWLVLFHRGTGAVAEPLDEAAISRHFREPVAEYFRRFRPAAAERRFLERQIAEAEGLRGVPLPLVLQHNDFCPQNLRIAPGPGGDRLGVIDWETPLRPRLPAFDLIHLLACLGVPSPVRTTAAPDDLDRFERAFLEDNPLSRAARDATVRYAAAMAIPREALRLLLAVYWVDYALEKADALDRAHGHEADSGIAAPDLGVWSLARFEDGTCVNLKLLAERERSIVFP